MIQCANPSAQFQSYRKEIEEAALKVMRSNTYILGKEVLALEEEFASYIKAKYAIGVANGTDAIEIALRALEIGLGDEVITVSHTAVATVAAIEATGARPVLVDVDPVFYTLNPAQLSEVLSINTKAVIAVHLYGQPADLDEISNFCSNHSLFLVEDVSQAHGAKYRGKRLGSIGHIGCFSCYPTKNLGAIGDAGLISTNDEELAKKIRMLREYGWVDRKSLIAGRNSRLDELQAAILRIKLKYLDKDNNKRVKLAKLYSSRLSKLSVCLPKIRDYSDPVFHLFVIQVSDQKNILKFLSLKGIHAGVHYPLPVHMHPTYLNRLNTAKDMSASETLVTKIVSLPMYPELQASEVEIVVDGIFEFYNSN